MLGCLCLLGIRRRERLLTLVGYSLGPCSLTAQLIPVF